ncbi:MAG: DNA mismatch repair protein MutS [Deltaproteobacteria bacterium]|nr:DNA mismatch repair protein MutS [Deltaproteobacteria bacterium]
MNTQAQNPDSSPAAAQQTLLTSERAGENPQKLPPMLTQYLEYKRQYSDCHLFFQVGDFYELFFEDAVEVSKALNLTLTSRDKNDPDPIPMCGVPISVIENYIERLVSRGRSVAIVSQTSAAQPGKGMVSRQLERVITPGIRIFSNSPDQAADAIVATAIVQSEQDVSLAFSDVQTGKVYVREGLQLAAFGAELQKVGASELILPKTIEGKPVDRRLSWVRECDRILKVRGLKFRPETYLDGGNVATRNFAAIKGYSSLSGSAKKAVRLLVNYVDETTLTSQVQLTEVSVKSYERALMIDASTRVNLELVRNARDAGTEGTLFEHLDCTQSAGGAKLLRQWILSPLCDVGLIQERQDAVGILMRAAGSRELLRHALSRITDCERVAARLELNIVSPRELGAVRDSLQRLPQLLETLRALATTGAKDGLLQKLEAGLAVSPQLPKLLADFLVDTPPNSVQEGGVVRDGFDAEVDSLRELKRSGTSWILELEAAEKARSGISSLKIKFNNVLGYFIEITRANVAKVPENYLRRQSTVNAERFTTPELKEREQQVLGADSKLVLRERALFEKFKSELQAYTAELRRIAYEYAQLDVLLALAEVSAREDFVAPVVDHSEELLITEGRHPMLAKRLSGAYVPNSLEMHANKSRCLLITGPNMGGKSTYIRQTALIVILAQMGCFVPAKAARLGVVDRVFARIGASDNIAEGESTFMVEMREASFILSTATSRSLLLIDEIGRGTATSDGLAIAQAILEWIVLKLKCRTLFATHFHELTGLEGAFPEVENVSVGSTDREGDVVFTHVICRGPANRSYGVEVAKLAGLPENLISRSRELLTGIESEQSVRRSRSSQLALFERPTAEAPKEPEDYAALKSLRQRIERISINDLSPLEALLNLNEIQTSLRKGNGS